MIYQVEEAPLFVFENIPSLLLLVMNAVANLKYTKRAYKVTKSEKKWSHSGLS